MRSRAWSESHLVLLVEMEAACGPHHADRLARLKRGLPMRCPMSRLLPELVLGQQRERGARPTDAPAPGARAERPGAAQGAEERRLRRHAVEVAVAGRGA